MSPSVEANYQPVPINSTKGNVGLAPNEAQGISLSRLATFVKSDGLRQSSFEQKVPHAVLKTFTRTLHVTKKRGLLCLNHLGSLCDSYCLLST